MDYAEIADEVRKRLAEVEAEQDRLRRLLGRYIRHVGEQEGIYFLGWQAKGVFTEEEIAELERLADEDV